MSMLELMIVMMIIIVVAAVSLPSFLEARDNYRLTAVSSAVSLNLSSARILAITRNADVRVYIISSTNYELQEDTGSWTTEESHDLPTGYTIAADSYAEFHYRGNATPVTTFTITDPNGLAKQVVVETSGRSYVQ